MYIQSLILRVFCAQGLAVSSLQFQRERERERDGARARQNLLMHFKFSVNALKLGLNGLEFVLHIVLHSVESCRAVTF